MTHPSSSETASVQPLTTVQRSVIVSVAQECLVNGSIDNERTLAQRCRDILRYEATIRELESRSPSPAPIDADEILGKLELLTGFSRAALEDEWIATYEKVECLQSALDDILNRNGLDAYVEARIEQGIAARSSSPSSGIATDDTARLDWLSQQAAAVMGSGANGGTALSVMPVSTGPGCFYYARSPEGWSEEIITNSLRDSIDAARSATPMPSSGDAPATPEDTELSERLDNIRRQYADRVIGYAEMSAQFENLARSHSETPNG